MAMDDRARVPASQAAPAITTGEVLQAARLAAPSRLTRMGPVALRPRLPTGLPFQEHLLSGSIGLSLRNLEREATSRSARPESADAPVGGPAGPPTERLNQLAARSS